MPLHFRGKKRVCLFVCSWKPLFPQTKILLNNQIQDLESEVLDLNPSSAPYLLVVWSWENHLNSKDLGSFIYNENNESHFFKNLILTEQLGEFGEIIFIVLGQVSQK